MTFSWVVNNSSGAFPHMNGKFNYHRVINGHGKKRKAINLYIKKKQLNISNVIPSKKMTYKIVRN